MKVQYSVGRIKITHNMTTVGDMIKRIVPTSVGLPADELEQIPTLSNKYCELFMYREPTKGEQKKISEELAHITRMMREKKSEMISRMEKRYVLH